MEANNAAAMRKALERQAHFLQRLHAQEGENGVVSKVRLEEEIKAVTAALSAPPRNCDVGTADEQVQRFYAFCQAHQSEIAGMCSDTCPCLNCSDMYHCLCLWAQLPYEKGENDGSK